MAYTQPRFEDSNTTLWMLGGLGVLAYLYYEGYLNGVVSPATNPSTDVNSGSIAPTVTQVANGEPFQVAQGASGSIVHPAGSSVIGIRQGGAPIGSRGPMAPNSQASNPNSVYSGGVSPSIWDLANESYYTWRASGEPYSRLLEIEAAANTVENGLYGSGQASASSGSPTTSVNTVSNTPTVNTVSTPTNLSAPVYDMVGPIPTSPTNYTAESLTTQYQVPGAPAVDQGAMAQLADILNNAPVNSQAFLDRERAQQEAGEAYINSIQNAMNASSATSGNPSSNVNVVASPVLHPTQTGGRR